jgi:hypothetical protein
MAKIALETLFDGVYGYHRTAEGRRFLRALYEPFLRRIDKSHGKVAISIADGTGSADSDKEVSATKTALARWNEGQAELWVSEPEKNARVLMRLEQWMMSEDEIAEILEQHAETTFKTDIGNSLALFGLGFDPTQERADECEAALKSMIGVFEEIPASGAPSKSAVLHYFFRPPGAPFLVTHEFAVPVHSVKPKGRKPPVYRKSAGYLVPNGNQSFFRAVINTAIGKMRHTNTLICFPDPNTGETEIHIHRDQQGGRTTFRWKKIEPEMYPDYIDVVVKYTWEIPL